MGGMMDRRKFFGSLFGTVATLIVLLLSFDHPKRNRCQEIADKFLAGFKERRRKASLQKNAPTPPSWRTAPNLPSYVQKSDEEICRDNRDVSRKKLYKILDKS
jgi:hypothetical protein